MDKQNKEQQAASKAGWQIVGSLWGCQTLQRRLGLQEANQSTFEPKARPLDV